MDQSQSQNQSQQKSPNVNAWWFKTAILSIALLVQAAPAVAGTLPLMRKTFSSQPLSAVETLSTVPNLGIMLFVILSSGVAKVIGNKKTVMLGLIIALIGGMTPIFTDNYTLVLVSRFALGAGIGLFNPLVYTFISYYYSGEELSKMYGYENAVANFGSAALTFLAGFLLAYGWHMAYWIYLVALFCILAFGLVVPNTKKKSTTSSSTKISTNKSVIGYAIYILMIYAAFYIVIVKLASVLMQKNYGNGSTASLLISIMTIFGVIASAMYGKIYKALGRFILPVCLLVMGIAMGVIAWSSNIWITGIALCVMGGCLILNPYLFQQANTKGPAGANTVSSSFLIMGMNLGCFLSPIAIDFVSGLFGNTQPDFTLGVAAVILLILSVVNGFLDMGHHSDKSQSN
ncbi:MFS transporter [Levilactobacillus bambusae]|uniref:Major facilitator superfamily (MFS) profile domain-containing protein n=1 Tax=Levilactobacillus bambusae TaxID=2024736 RepID=A0A2V1N142_9LACO|nr:MFS transporter [Levilactobacillus bambusae]PWG00105.1 hypothetical protein DCM90_04000 [Levilactobacillus bambusae]